jgi:hypothetical protein
MQDSTDVMFVGCVRQRHTNAKGTNKKMHTIQLTLRMNCKLFPKKNRLPVISHKRRRMESHPCLTIRIYRHILKDLCTQTVIGHFVCQVNICLRLRNEIFCIIFADAKRASPFQGGIGANDFIHRLVLLCHGSRFQR